MKLRKLEEVYSNVFVATPLPGVEIFLEAIASLVTRVVNIEFSQIDQGSPRHHPGIIRHT